MCLSKSLLSRSTCSGGSGGLHMLGRCCYLAKSRLDAGAVVEPGLVVLVQEALLDLLGDH